MSNSIIHLYNPTSFVGFPPEDSIRIVLQLSQRFQALYHTDTLSLTYFITDTGIRFCSCDCSVYSCPIRDLLEIARENAYEVRKIPQSANITELMLFYKSLHRRGVEFIPTNSGWFLMKVPEYQRLFQLFFRYITSWLF